LALALLSFDSPVIVGFVLRGELGRSSLRRR
jgi:hypothetical protein